MTYEEFNEFCGSMKATSHVIQWGGAHVWKVGGKVFAIGGWGDEGNPRFTFKTSDLNFHFLRDHPGYRPAPYFASRGMKWIQQHDGRHRDDEELRYYLGESYRLVSLGLSKKLQKQLDLNKA